MDIKSKINKLGNFINKYYKTVIALFIISIATLVLLKNMSYSNYHSDEYRWKKEELEYWHIWKVDETIRSIYAETDYLKAFDKSQKELDAYSNKVKDGMVEYIFYNEETKKYLTNSEDIKNSMENDPNSYSSVVENFINKYQLDELGNKREYDEKIFFQSKLDELNVDYNVDEEKKDGEEEVKYREWRYTERIKNPENYIAFFWIPEKEFMANGYYEIIKTEDNRVEREIKNHKTLIFLSATAMVMLGIATLYILKRRLNLDKELIKLLKNTKEFIFDIRSIPFKATLLWVIGIGLTYQTLKWNFYGSDYTYTYIIIINIIYFVVIGLITVYSYYFTVRLQKIINSTKDPDIDIEKSRFEEKNLLDLINNIETMKESSHEAILEKVKSERLKAELVTNISHDLKTPLTSIINYTDILLNKDVTDEEREDYLKVLNNKSLKLKLLIEDLFQISKISSGKEELNKEEVDIMELINQSLGELSSSIEKSNIEFNIISRNKELILNLDGGKISRVFENLISNITKYSLKGTRAYIEIVDKENQVNIIFKNISSEKLDIDAEEIFNRFTRGDASRNSKIEGNGLGLCISKSLIELHNGSINVVIDGDLFKVEISLPK